MKESREVIFESYQEMCRQIAEEIRDDLKKNPQQMLCIAAGNTSQGVFEELIDMYQNKEIDFSKAYFVAMDEWVGMNGDTPDSCGNFLIRNFLRYVNYPKEHIRLWNGKAEDLEAECQSVETFLKHAVDYVMDYLVLGTGMNGHLALNEPGADFEMRSHIHELDNMTKTVGQKYFENGATLTKGITMGIRNFYEAKRTVLMINGRHKRKITKKILDAKHADNRIPATVLYDFPNGSIYCDSEAVGV